MITTGQRTCVLWRKRPQIGSARSSVSTYNLLGDITADIAFLGADGLIVDGGATNANVLIAEADREMAERVRKTILVVNSSRIGQAGFVPIRRSHPLMCCLLTRMRRPTLLI